MTQLLALSSVEHHDLRIALGHEARFGDAVNQVLVLPTEFEEAQREYPIILRRNEAGEYQAIALLGLERGENLFVEGGRWDAWHVPLMRQRGPFRIGLPGAREAAGEASADASLHIDLDDPRVSRSEGEPLFLPHGGHSPYLDHMVRVMRAIHDGVQAAPPLYDAWAEAGLFEPMTLRLSLDDRTQYDVPDAIVIPPARLAALDGATLERLNRAGQLRPAMLLSASLGNMGRLMERKNRRRIAGTRAPERVEA